MLILKYLLIHCKLSKYLISLELPPFPMICIKTACIYIHTTNSLSLPFLDGRDRLPKPVYINSLLEQPSFAQRMQHNNNIAKIVVI